MTTAKFVSALLTTTFNLPTFLFGILVLLYLSTFVVFAVLRILTGVSIQRVGYFSLKRISLELRDGIRLEIRKLGLNLHRPTFAQPSWVSIVIQDSQLTFDFRIKEDENDLDDGKREGNEEGGREKAGDANGETRDDAKKDRTAEQLRTARGYVTKLHRWIKWLRMVDIMVLNTNVTVLEVGSLQMASVSLMVDTRRKAADRNRMFDHCTELKEGQRPIEWIFAARSILLLPENKDPVELLDNCSFNIYGVLETDVHNKMARDVAAAIKFGRISIPLDELSECAKKLKCMRKDLAKRSFRYGAPELSLSTVMEEMALPGSRTERMAEALIQSKEFLHGVLTGVMEVQFAIGYLLVTKSIPKIRPSGRPIQVMLGMKELGMDVHKLDEKSPAHRMYFSKGDIAHQALLAAISMSVSVSDGVRKDRLLYVPMFTMTSRTTLLSKTIEIVENSELDRNSNILFANLVVTSPSIDLEPRHLPLMLAILESRSGRPAAPSAQKTRLISRLLPKASIKFSVQEPVIRVVLPPPNSKPREPGDLDMLISSLSSISADIDSFHEDDQSRYALNSSFRIASYDLYYRAASGERHDLLQTESFELKAQLIATPVVQVTVQADLETFTLRLVRPEIIQGIKQMIMQLRKSKKPRGQSFAHTGESSNFLRKAPMWLNQFRWVGNDCTIEVAGVDEEVSEATHGAALQIDNWTVEYKCRKAEAAGHRVTPRRRALSRTINPEDTQKTTKPIPYSKNPTDGRKLTVHMHGVEGFMIDSPDSYEQDPFMAVPHLDLALSTSTDPEGPTLHIYSLFKSFFFHYSLRRHYAAIVAAQVLREAFLDQRSASEQSKGFQSPGFESPPTSPDTLRPPAWGEMDLTESPVSSAPEYTSIDFKVQHLQIKASLPKDPPMMLEVFGLDTGRRRWGFPFAKAKNVRLYAESPTVKKCWARIVSMRNFRVDLREMRRRNRGFLLEEKLIDIAAEAIRLAVPHQLILYQITDNVINTIKSSQQMHHRFKTGRNEDILEKKAEGPKIVPKISMRTKALLFEIEDDPFETRLALIYRLGLSEQKKRLAREAAFEAKAEKMQENDRRRSWETTRTAPEPLKPRGRSRTWRPDIRPKSQAGQRDPSEVKPRPRSRSSAPRGRQNMRYDPESAEGPSEEASVSIEEARVRLQEHNSIAWIKRIKWAKQHHTNHIKEARDVFWGPDEIPYDIEETENIIGLPTRPALLAAFFNDVDITIDKPSFALTELPKFMHRVGKGLPKDTVFSLLVPMSIKLNFGETRILLRDYPLPLLHVPQLAPSQSVRRPSWSLQAEWVIAEELRGPESMRHALVNIVPPIDGTSTGGYNIDVRRTVSAVKTYSDIKVNMNTSYPTRITWGTSYQPAIQDMMMVFETFTKPHVDPSERTGFWDKLRLIMHSQITMAWEGDGDVHLTLKGSRDPYKITGDGAGFVLCWRSNVRWNIARDDDPRKFMKVESEELFLAVPDFNKSMHDDLDGTGAIPDTKSVLSANSFTSDALFKKVIMKLSGGVSWIVGLMFEQEISNEEDWKQRKRSFEFKPHYDVTLKSPEFAKAPPGEVYDAFKGFRSHHLHLSLEIVSPINPEWSPESTSSTNYNTIHLTPRFFTHFFSWWHLFSGVMSLPIRQGTLWPGPEKSNKKFARHLATIKYKLCLSPLFISHIYKHTDRDESNNDIVAATGLKARLDKFLLDIHQRREETLPNPNSTAMKINQAEVDLHTADIRAVSAIIAGVSMDELLKQASETPQIMHQDVEEQFRIHDSDPAWIDMDDFVELDWILQSNKTPDTKIMPIGFAPRFTYFRQTDHFGARNSSPFGHEASHHCVMSQNNDPREIQCDLVQARLERVNQQMNRNKQAIEDLAKDTRAHPTDVKLKAQSEKLIEQSSILFNKLNFLQGMLRKMSSKLDAGDKSIHSMHHNRNDSDTDSEFMDEAPFDYASDFDNRFIIHNLQAKWNNSLRNIIVKYIHQVSQRRGFTYYMSRRAVKFILDIIEEQKRAMHQNGADKSDGASTGPSSTPQEDNDESTLNYRIQQLLNDDVKFVVADEQSSPTRPSTTHGGKENMAKGDLGEDVADEYVPLNGYHIRLIAPQIQMQSEKNTGAAVLVAAEGMQLKVVSIMDKDRIGDEVSGLVQRRFALNLDNTQFYVTQHPDFAPEDMSLHSANQYGAPKGSSWPPWVPLESIFDFQNNPVGFSRVVERTSAALRYDKHNTLRLKYSDQVSGVDGENRFSSKGPLDTERRVDHIWVDFPRVEASCDSKQYFAMYILVIDLLLYAEPLEKLRSEKLEKIMLASDFSDLTGAPEMVQRLQGRILQLQEIKTFFQVNSDNLDEEGWRSRIIVDNDLFNCEEELFFMMKAITTAQRKYEDRSSQASGVTRWYLSASSIIWHLLREKADPLMEIRLTNAGYTRVDNTDGSNFNTVEVEMVRGFNLLPNAAYPEMIAPYYDQTRSAADMRDTKMLRVYWHMLEAIAGIPVMDHFEVNLFPLKIQLEREIGEKAFEYIFPGGSSAFEKGDFSPFLIHSMKPVPDPAENGGGDLRFVEESRHMDDSSSTSSDLSGMEMRLRPTLSLSTDHRPMTAHSEKTRPKTSSAASVFSFRGAPKTLSRKGSHDALSVMGRRSLEGPAPSVYSTNGDKSKKQLFNRSPSNGRADREEPSDELSQMMSRASNYMTLAYIKIPSVVLCLSYKGRGDSNIEDIHEFVFRMPMLEYRNKTWSNLDLAIRLKKDIIRALVSHTGAIIHNKITHHRPTKPQPNLLRMAANSGSFEGSSSIVSGYNSDVASTYGNPDITVSPHDSLLISRTNTSYSSSLAPPQFSRQATHTSYSDNRVPSMYAASTSSGKETEAPNGDGDEKGGLFSNTLGRHLAHLATVARLRDGIADDSEESNKKKSRLLLGKKAFSHGL